MYFDKYFSNETFVQCLTDDHAMIISHFYVLNDVLHNI
jgi:hypothetical protein